MGLPYVPIENIYPHGLSKEEKAAEDKNIGGLSYGITEKDDQRRSSQGRFITG